MDKIIDKIINEMTLDEKLGQMFFVKPETLTNTNNVFGFNNRFSKLVMRYLFPNIKGITRKQKRVLNKIPVGGIILFERHLQNRHQVATYINDLQDCLHYPMFIACDEEGGSVRRLSRVRALEVTKHPDMRDIGDTKDPDQAKAIGITMGREMTELGFNVNFAPMADIHTKETNAITLKRAFSSDAETTAEMVRAMVEGMQSQGISATLKHFPGHGSVLYDSHFVFPESSITLNKLRKNDLLPFKAGIEAGADFVMIAHLAFPKVLGSKVPCPMSRKLIMDMLKRDLAYENIVICDSLEMHALKEFNKNIVSKCIIAGVDMILMPLNLKKDFKKVKRHVLKGVIAEERINDAVRRILKVKIKQGLLKPEDYLKN